MKHNTILALGDKSDHGQPYPRWRQSHLLLLLVFCIFTISALADDAAKWVAPAAQAAVKNPVSVSPVSLQAGQKIYAKRCAACHGKSGKGDGYDAIDLGLHPTKFSDPKLREESDGALFWKITKGKKPMPDYGSRLSATDRWNVINYVRSLGGGNEQ